MSEITKSLHRHYRRFRERMTEEMGLQMFPENRFLTMPTFSGRVLHSRAAATSSIADG